MSENEAGMWAGAITFGVILLLCGLAWLFAHLAGKIRRKKSEKEILDPRLKNGLWRHDLVS